MIWFIAFGIHFIVGFTFGLYFFSAVGIKDYTWEKHWKEIKDILCMKTYDWSFVIALSIFFGFFGIFILIKFTSEYVVWWVRRKYEQR